MAFDVTGKIVVLVRQGTEHVVPHEQDRIDWELRFASLGDASCESAEIAIAGVSGSHASSSRSYQGHNVELCFLQDVANRLLENTELKLCSKPRGNLLRDGP